MTREEAIKVLEPFKACMFDQHGCPISDAAIALDVAIEALKAQMDGDTISRQEAAGIVLFECGEFVGLAETIIKRFEELPSAHPEPCEDAVSRKLMYELGATCMARRDENGELVALGRLDMLPSVQPERKTGKWIPVKNAPMDSEERGYWEDQFGKEFEDEDAVMFDCPMPEDGQEILVSYRKWISMDKCEIDGGCYGLEGNGDWEDVTAWMPLPEPYRQKEEP